MGLLLGYWSLGLVLGQGYTSGSTVESTDCVPVTMCTDGCGSCWVPGRVLCRSLGGSTGWGPGLKLRGART